MTPTMKEMLADIADGSDPNLIAQIARVMGKQAEHRAARTILALLRHGMLQFANKGGLEISDQGRAAAAKIKHTKEQP